MKPLLLKYDLGQKIKEYGTWELAATPQICHWKQEKKKKKEEEEGLTIQSDTFIIYIILVYYLLFRCGLYLNLLERIK